MSSARWMTSLPRSRGLMTAHSGLVRAVRAAATEVIHPNALTWVIVGDLSKIEAGVRGLKLGDVQVIDADGKPVAPAK